MCDENYDVGQDLTSKNNDSCTHPTPDNEPEKEALLAPAPQIEVSEAVSQCITKPKLIKQQENESLFSEDSEKLNTHRHSDGDDRDSATAVKKKRWSFFGPQHRVYISQFLSSWGDRMWMFAGGLFLIEITPGSLRLVAIYESALSFTVIFFGSAIGRWVDRTPRLRAAQSSLITQNLMVCVCTLLLCLLISYDTYFTQSLNGWGAAVTQAAVVFLACVAQTGSLGSTLAIEKDWIVVISEDRKVKLSTMNSVLRTVDLSTELMAPVLVGFVMTSAGMVVGGVFIAAWNVTSLVFEYGLLHFLYYRVPALQRPKEAADDAASEGGGRSVSGYLQKVKLKAKDAAVMWKRYFNHNIRDAGLALSLLFMTVLSLDNFSRAYVYESGVSKGVLGILTACASLLGICGSLAFPRLRKRIGVSKTGILGFVSQSLCLLCCVASVFAPGTNFQPFAAHDSQTTNTVIMGGTLQSTTPPSHSSNPLLADESLPKAPLANFNSSQRGPLLEGGTLPPSYKEGPDTSVERDYTSVALLLTGIITSRFGLWLADLTVTQLLQEQVAENERGGINGVQSSLNQSLSLLRSVLIIILPTLGTFGYLIILSFVFVVAGTIMFCIYTYKARRKSLPSSSSEA